ncbi:MAG: bacillithiol system redox-active protein YtxJ [Thermoanaerobaculia bacterium]
MADTPALCRVSTLAQLDDWLAASSDRPVWLFKHSLVCPTSHRALSEFASFVRRGSEVGESAVIEIQRARDVSKEVAARAAVKHESPQALLFRHGRVVWHASHWNITETALREAASTHEADQEMVSG